MSRENIYLSIILKKQPYGEGDELVTVYTREAGKLRALAKSTKFSRSKLQYGLQVLFLTRLTLTRSGLPKIIGTEAVQLYPRIRDDLQALKVVFYVLELVLKFTPDEQKNQELFDLIVSFLNFLDHAAGDEAMLNLGLAKFKIDFLFHLGLSIHAEPPAGFSGQIRFSGNRGGFLFGADAADASLVSLRSFERFAELKNCSYDDLLNRAAGGDPNIGELQELLSRFVEFQLERGMMSERFLRE